MADAPETVDDGPLTPPAPSLRRVVVVVGPLIAAFLVLALLIVHPWHKRESGVGFGNLGAAPSYTLTDQNAKQVSSSAFNGKIQVVSFLFPFCTTYCPYTTHQLSVLEKRLADAGLADKVQFVAFNLAPADSGPSDLATYLSQYGVAPTDPHWSFLTGTQADVDAAVRGTFGVQYQKIPLDTGHPNGADAVPVQPNALAEAKHVNFDIVHNEVITIVGPDGVIRGAFDHVVDVTTNELYDTVTKLLAAS
ncbi:MAG: hypothetical protein QOG52_768 [Frankiaceae bacterium]|nr:hypothetical protein [Frankiaceae bacterium]